MEPRRARPGPVFLEIGWVAAARLEALGYGVGEEISRKPKVR